MKSVASRLALFVVVALTIAGCRDTQPDTSDSAPPSTSALYDWLVDEQVPVRSTLAVDVSGLPTVDPADPRHAVGVTADLGVRVDLADLSASHLTTAPLDVASGAIRSDEDGFVWSGVVVVDRAWGVRLELSDVHLPDGALLYVYNDDGEVVGPYTGASVHGDGSFWTHMVRGDRVNLQLRYTGRDIADALATTRFVIADVGVLDDRFVLARFGSKTAEKAFCSFNEDCVHNASCSSIPSAVQAARDAVALILFTSGAYQYICSGGLVADAANSGTPYFLTANHCVSRSKEANSLQTFFDFRASCGDNSCAFPNPSTADTTGSSIRASNKTSDFTLLELSGNAPAGAVFLPTNNSPVAYSNGASLYRISHPGGAPQAYSEHSVDASTGTCSSWPRGNWIYSRDTYGATEGGSSGSPVLNAAGEVVGQLSGGCGTNVYDVCDNVNNATVDGALAAYWDQVAPFLGGNQCTAEDCNDGIDNDCDGAVDDADSDCSGGSCSPSGASCSSNSDCCSNKCKGPPSNKTCN